MHVHAYYGVTYEYVSVVLAENKFYMERLVRILISRLRYSVVVSRDLKHNTQFKALGGNYSKVIGISYWNTNTEVKEVKDITLICIGRLTLSFCAVQRIIRKSQVIN